MDFKDYFSKQASAYTRYRPHYPAPLFEYLAELAIDHQLAWDCATANVYEGTAFQHLVDGVADEKVVFADDQFKKKDWQPPNLRVCQRGEWNDRMIIESVLSMLTVVCHIKKMRHRVWSYFKSHLGYLMALFNVLVQWHGLQPDENGFVPLSIAEFSL